ncbi:MAG: sulfurtransferase, partial [Thermomicrobiales bacterium]
QTIISFIMNLLFSLLLLVLSFFGISTGVSEGFDSGSSTPAYEEPAVSTVTAGDISQSSGDLVNAAWLSTQLDNPNLRVVAVAPTSDFQAGHIPGATQVDYSALEISDTSATGLNAWESQVSSTLTALGITPDSTVVVYDYGTHYSPRLWWVLKQFDQANVYLLDGGFQSWESSSLAVETGLPQTPPPAAPFDASPDASTTADTSAVQAAIGSSGVALVDARTPGEYAAGHIPGAINIPFTDNYAADGTLLDIDALTELYASQGVTPDQAVIVYCSTGIRASSDVFALEYLAYLNVRLYLGSYNEWSADPSLPIEK